MVRNPFVLNGFVGREYFATVNMKSQSCSNMFLYYAW